MKTVVSAHELPSETQEQAELLLYIPTTALTNLVTHRSYNDYSEISVLFPSTNTKTESVIKLEYCNLTVTNTSADLTIDYTSLFFRDRRLHHVCGEEKITSIHRKKSVAQKVGYILKSIFEIPELTPLEKDTF